MNRLLIGLAFLTLAACSPMFEGRIAAKLQGAGVPKPMAECMARRWVKRLDVAQLREVERLSGELSKRYKDRTLTVPGLVDEVSSLDDPEIIRVVTASAAACALKT